MEKDTSQIFDTSIELKAREAGIYNEKIHYTPLVFILGEKEVLPALEEDLKAMKVGEHKEITLTPDKAFGERNADYIKVVPLQEFKNRNITPFPGLVVELNNLTGRVQSISGGRVRVDFNHPLAGKTVIYTVTVLDKVTDNKSKAELLFSKYFDFLDKSALLVKDTEVLIKIPAGKGMQAVHAIKVKRLFSRKLMKVTNIEKVVIQEEFLKSDKENKTDNGLEAES
jgi:FKBP-type peptidyl-prolyl cis-trans isomerase 2